MKAQPCPGRSSSELCFTLLHSFLRSIRHLPPLEPWLTQKAAVFTELVYGKPVECACAHVLISSRFFPLSYVLPPSFHSFILPFPFPLACPSSFPSPHSPPLSFFSSGGWGCVAVKALPLSHVPHPWHSLLLKLAFIQHVCEFFCRVHT